MMHARAAAHHEGMRLVLAWLIGVPLLVGSMVLARAALLPQPGHAITAPRAQPPAQVQAQVNVNPQCQPRHADAEGAVAVTPGRMACDPHAGN